MTKHWESAVMIPACREAELLPGCLASLAAIPGHPIVVLVLNERQGCDIGTTRENDEIRDWLKSHASSESPGGHPIFNVGGLDVLLLDHALGNRRLSPRQGVGYARHLGMLHCCELIEAGLVQSRWIWSTDADARFASDYLQEPPDDAEVCILPYRHHPAPISLQIYDIGLRYFALGLDWAKTPYAFPTLGSVIAIDSRLYRRVGGFPDRQAGEDFYLLNKASKVGSLRYLNRQPVTLNGRPSDRVPFGTGRAMMEIEAKSLQHQFYSPDSFFVLRRFVEILNQVSDELLIEHLHALVPGFPGLKKLAKVLRQPVRGAQMIKRRHAFFDAFWIMKLMHYLRDTTCPSVSWRQALDEAPFIQLNSDEPMQIKHDLEEAERHQLCGREFGMKALLR